MKCDNCGRSNVWTVSEDGVSGRECPHCLRARIDQSPIMSLMERMIPLRTERTACPYCGQPESTIAQTGQVGCPLCYEAMSPLVFERLGLRSGGQLR